MNNRNTALLDPAEFVRCPRCMGTMENVMLSDLPPEKWEYPEDSIHIGGGVDHQAPVKACKAIGECWEHGVQTIKI